MNVTFITGNQGKAEIMQKYLGLDIAHQAIELEEIQSMDLHEIAAYKVKQAYAAINKPVLVEDVGLFINSMGGLPGPLVKWFLKTVGTEGICRLADANEDRSATAKIVYAFFDGQSVKFFDGQIEGQIAPKPQGEGFGWNPCFIPSGSTKSYAQMDDNETGEFSLRTKAVFPQLKVFLTSFLA